MAFRDYPAWMPSAAFLLLLLVIPNNKFMGLVLLITLLFTVAKTKTFTEAVFYMMVLCLPFTKGKGFQFILLNAQQTGANVPYTFDFDIMFWYAFLSILIYLILRNRRHIPRVSIQKSDGILIVFILSMIPSIFLSGYPWIAALGFIELSVLIVLYFVTKLVKPYIAMRTCSILIALQLMFEGAWSIAQYLLNRPLGSAIESSGGLLTQSNLVEYAFEQVGFFRSRGTFDQSNSLGSFAGSLIPFTYILLMYKTNTKIEKRIYALATLLGMGAVIVSGSRTSMVITIAFFTIMFFIRKKQHLPLFYLGRLAKSLTLGALILLIPIAILPRILQLGITLQEGGGLTYRMDLNSYAVDITKNNFFGVGLGLFPKVVSASIGTFHSFPTQPHNLFAQIGAECGYIAFIVFCIFLYVILRNFIQKILRRSRRSLVTRIGIYQLASAVSITVILVLSNFYPFLLRSTVFPYFWLFLAFIT